MKNAQGWPELFSYIEYLEAKSKAGRTAGTNDDDPIIIGYEQYNKKVASFIKAFYDADIADTNYFDTLSKSGIATSHESIAANIETASKPLLISMLTCYIRQDRFNTGLIAAAIENGNMAHILKRLQCLYSRESAEDRS